MLSEENIESRSCLSANQTQVLAIYIFTYCAWYNCICFVSKILVELIITVVFHLLTEKETPTG